MPLLETDAIAISSSFDQLPEDAKPLASDWMKRYRDQQEEYGQPLFPNEAQKERKQKHRFRSMFTDLKKVDELAPSLTAILPYSANPDADRARVANINFLSRRYGLPIDRVGREYPLFQTDYLVKKGLKTEMDDLGFYQVAKGEVDGEIKAEEAQDTAVRAAYQSIVSGKGAVASLNEWQAANADQMDLTPKFMAAYTQAASVLRPYKEFIAGSVKKLQSYQGTEGATPREDAASAYTDIAKNLLALTPAKRALVIDAIGIAGGAEDKKGFLLSLAKEMGRGMEDVVRGPVQFLARGAMQDLEASAASSPFITTEQRAQLTTDAREVQDYVDLIQEIRDVAEGTIDPIKGSNLISRGLLSAGRSLPGTVTALAGLPGTAAVAGMIAEQNYHTLRRQNPGMSREDAQSIAAIAAPFQAAAERFVDAKLLTGKFPSLSKLMNQAVATPAAFAARVGIRTVEGTAVEMVTENLQDATPIIVQALSSDVPGVDWQARLGEFKGNQLELLASVVPLVLIGAGAGSVNDFKDARALMADERALRASGVKREQAQQIVSLTEKQQWAEAQNLLRETQSDPAPKAEIAAARTEAAQAAREQVAQETERMKAAEVSIRRTADAWEVNTPDGTASFGDWENAYLAAASEMERQEMTRDEQTLKVFEAFSQRAKEGEEFTISDEALSLADAEADAVRRGDQANVDAIWNRIEVERSRLGRDDIGLADMRVFGRSSVEAKEGIKTYASRIFEGGKAIDLVEEKAESDVKRWIDQGRTSLTSLADAIRQVEQVTGDTYLFGDSDTAVIEAYSALARLYTTGTRKGNDVSGAVRKQEADVIRGQRKRLQSAKEKAPGLLAKLQETLEFFKQVLRQAARLMKAKKEGKLGDIEQFLNESLGLSEEAAHVEAVTTEVQDMAEGIARNRELLAKARDTLAGKGDKLPDSLRQAFGGSRAIPTDTFSLGLYEGSGLPGKKGVEWADGESRIVQGLAQAGFDGQGAVGLVRPESEKPDAYTNPGRSIPPYTEQASVSDIFTEEERLIERAKSEGFFWDSADIRKVIDSASKKGGGSEHDVYIVGNAPSKIVIRSTIQDSYGFRHRSPTQYLKRLENYNAAFPGIQTRLIGVSLNSRGNGVIWTAQPFVEGRELREESDIQKALEARGWERISSDSAYRHEETGTIIRDAHAGNILVKGQELYPIDVIVDNVAKTSPDTFSIRATEMGRQLLTEMKTWQHGISQEEIEANPVKAGKKAEKLRAKAATEKLFAMVGAEDEYQAYIQQMRARGGGVDEGEVAEEYDFSRTDFAKALMERVALEDATRGSYSIGLSDRLDALSAVLDEQTKAKPEARRAMMQRAQDRLMGARAVWERIDRSAKELARTASETPDRYGAELAQLRADLQIDLEQIRSERTLEIEGARQDNASRETLNRIRAEFEASLTKRRMEYEREKRKLEEREQAEESAQAKEQGRISKAEMTAAMRALDAVVSVLPPEVRGKVGGFIKLAELTTTAQRIDEIERRFEKVGELLESYFKKELTEQVEKLFERYRPERSAGEKPKGKLDPDAQELVDAAEAAMSLTAEQVAGELGRIDALLADPDITPEREVHLERQRVLVELFGDWKGADAGRMDAALTALQSTAGEGWAKWRLQQLLKREERQTMRDALRNDTGKAGLAGERDAMLQESAGVIGKSRDTFINLSSFSDVLRYVFGQKSKTAQALVDAERDASNQYEDAIQAMADRVQDHFTALSGGVLRGEQMRFDMAQPKITVGKGTMNERRLSELQAIQALLMWQQEDGRRHMEGPRDESNQPIPGKWSYTQEWIDELTSKLPPRALRTKVFLESLYAEEYGPLNAIYRERHGVNLPQHKLYAPITVAPQQAKAGEMVDPVSGAAITGSILTPGALRSRARNAVAEPRFEDALATLLAHNKQMEHWKAYYDFALNAQAVMGNREVMNSAEAAGGKEAVSMLKKWVEAFAQGGMRDAAAGLATTRWAQRIASRAATVGLLGRVSTLLVQSTQLAAASVQMPTGAYVLRLSKLLTGNLEWGGAIRSEFIQRRIKTAPPIVQQAMATLGTVKRPNQITRAVRFLGNLLSGADGLFTGGTYAILLDYHRGTATKMGLDGAEAEAFAHQEAARTTEEVAQPVRMGTRSMMELTMTNPFAKIGWAYASEARQKITLFAWAAREGKTDPARAAKAAFLTFIVGGLMSQIIKNLWREMKGDDDERKWSAERLALAMASGPLHGLPLFSTVIEGSNMFSSLEWTGAALNDVANGEADMRDANTILGALGYTNDTLAGMAALSNAGLDFAQLLKNAFSDEE